MSNDIEKREEYQAIDIELIREAQPELLELRQASGGKLQIHELPKATLNGAGASDWSVADARRDALEGVVVETAVKRMKFDSDYKRDEADPPVCVSDDGVTGHGEPGGECESCPFNQWGSGKGGTGKACSEYLYVLLLEPGGTLPVVVQLPPTSLAPWRKFRMAALTRGAGVSRSLVRLSAKDGKVSPEVVRPLTQEEIVVASEYRTWLFGNG